MAVAGCRGRGLRCGASGAVRAGRGRGGHRPVRHAYLGPSFRVPDDDARPVPGRVLGHVRQRLLDDPVHGPPDGRQRVPGRRFALHAQPDVEPGRGGAVHQGVELGESGAGPGPRSRLRRLAQHTDHLAEPVDGGARPGADVAGGGPGVLGQTGGQLQRPRRQGDEAEVVAEEVVHVLCYPGPFAQPGLFGDQALFPLQSRGPLPPGPHQLAVLAQEPAREPRQHRRHQQQAHEPARPPQPRRHQEHGHHGCREHCGQGRAGAPVPPRLSARQERAERRRYAPPQAGRARADGGDRPDEQACGQYGRCQPGLDDHCSHGRDPTEPRRPPAQPKVHYRSRDPGSGIRDPGSGIRREGDLVRGSATG